MAKGKSTIVKPRSYFLLVFDREQRKLIRIEEFADSEAAIRARFECEVGKASEDVEIVVLGAASREALENTHSRYFGNGLELTPA
jgi:hypothetical protein